MSDELTRLLTETLRSREADVVLLPGLSARVLQKGRSARSRRLALGWGATGVVAAAAVVAVALMGPAVQHAPNPGPANSRMPSPSPSPSVSVTKIATGDPLWNLASQLPVGPPIAVIPRAEKRGNAVVVVTADHVVTLPHAGGAYDLTPSTEGLLVSASSEWFTGGDTDPDQALYLIRPGGSLTTLHHGPFHGAAVDPTGKEYAIAEIGERIGSPVNVVTASLSDPGKTRSHSEAFATTLLGWTTQGLLLSDSSRTWLWEPGASSETEIPGVSDVQVMPTDPGRLLATSGQAGGPFCLHLFAVGSGQLGTKLACGAEKGWTVSPDGRRVVVGSTVVDLATGRAGPDLMDNLVIQFPHWEDSTHLLTHIFASEPTQEQLVTSIWLRCEVATGVCEQAPMPRTKGTSAVLDW